MSCHHHYRCTSSFCFSCQTLLLNSFLATFVLLRSTFYVSCVPFVSPIADVLFYLGCLLLYYYQQHHHRRLSFLRPRQCCYHYYYYHHLPLSQPPELQVPYHV